MKTERCDFDVFKSNVCHKVKELGDIGFIFEILKSNTIFMYFNKKWYAESLYLLAMVDYLSNINNVPICTNYNALRTYKLEKTLYPASLVMMSKITRNSNILKESFEKSIPEFKRFNIVENEVRNIV